MTDPDGAKVSGAMVTAEEKTTPLQDAREIQQLWRLQFSGAEFGAQVVRNGTNQIHGSAYVFQDAYLNANQYQNVPNQNLCYPGTTGCTNTITPTRRGNDQLSQTGFVIDGPVFIPKLYNGHDKTFFTLASER